MIEAFTAARLSRSFSTTSSSVSAEPIVTRVSNDPSIVSSPSAASPRIPKALAVVPPSSTTLSCSPPPPVSVSKRPSPVTLIVASTAIPRELICRMTSRSVSSPWVKSRTRLSPVLSVIRSFPDGTPRPLFNAERRVELEIYCRWRLPLETVDAAKLPAMFKSDAVVPLTSLIIRLPSPVLESFSSIPSPDALTDAVIVEPDALIAETTSASVSADERSTSTETPARLLSEIVPASTPPPPFRLRSRTVSRPAINRRELISEAGAAPMIPRSEAAPESFGSTTVRFVPVESVSVMPRPSADTLATSALPPATLSAFVLINRNTSPRVSTE